MGLFGARVCDPQRCGWFKGAAARRPVLRWEYQDAPSVTLLLPFDSPSCDKFFRNPTPEANDQSDHLRSRQLPRRGRRGGGCSHRRLRPSARPTMAVSRKKSCGRRSQSAGAARSMPSLTNTEAMRAAGWEVFRQTEVTGPMCGDGDLAGRICRCSGFWSRPVFGSCRRARCARSVAPIGLRPLTLKRLTNPIGGANTASFRTSN